MTAPASLTVVVRQFAGIDPVVDELAKPHINCAEYPSWHMVSEKLSAS